MLVGKFKKTKIDQKKNIFFENLFSNLKKSQDKIKTNQTAIEQIQKKRTDLNARLEKLEELAKNADEKKTEIEVRFNNLNIITLKFFLFQNDLETNKINMNELRDTIRTTEAELANIEKEIVHLKHEYEAAQKELAQCRHEISVIDVEVYF